MTWYLATQKAFEKAVIEQLRKTFSLPTNAKPENYSPAIGESPALNPPRHKTEV